MHQSLSVQLNELNCNGSRCMRMHLSLRVNENEPELHWQQIHEDESEPES